MNSWAAWERGIKRSLLIWHRRAGKDEVELHKTAIAAHLRPANYWHCLPQFSSARRAIWEAVNPHTGKKRIDEAFPREVRRTTREDTMTIEFHSGSVWRVVGSDDPDSLVGAPPAGIVFSEWALSNPSAWGYLAPIVEENNGWADFVTTPRGRNHVKSMLDMAKLSPEWFSEVLTVRETGYPIDRVEEQRLEYHSIFGRDAGDALIEQEYYCSFEAAILGAIYGREMVDAEKAGRICEVPIEPSLPIHTVWDIGKHNNMAIWVFQIHFDQIRVIDFLRGHGVGFPSHVEELERRGYRGGDDWVPHDARVKELGTERTRVETLRLLGRKPKLVPMHKLEDGINAGRQTLPHCWFDAERCAFGIEALRQYQYEWDDDKKTFGKIPLHDWASHPADAFRYLAMAWRDMTPEPVEEKKPGRILTVNQPEVAITMDEAWALLDKQNRGSVRV